MPLLSVNNIEVIYDDVILVLKGMSLTVDEGKIVALLGANGAGKTTTLKAISGLLKTEEGEVTDGTIEFDGKKINGWEPEEPVSGNAYAMRHPEHLALPRTLWEAAQCLKASEAARDMLGDAFVDHFAASREWEEREYRRHISDWELERYFEII